MENSMELIEHIEGFSIQTGEMVSLELLMHTGDIPKFFKGPYGVRVKIGCCIVCDGRLMDELAAKRILLNYMFDIENPVPLKLPRRDH